MPAKRPMELDADVVRFQNNKEKWIAFIGLYNGRPYEIFTGIADDEEGIMLPKAVTSGKIVKHYDLKEIPGMTSSFRTNGVLKRR